MILSGHMGNIKYYISRSIENLGDRMLGRKYRIIEKIVDEFDKSDTCPDILYLGDSTVLRAANEDTDKKTIGEMLAADLKGKANVLELSHGAYHMEIFFHIISTLRTTRHRPKLIVLPVNMRSFSPQWHMQPDWQFKEEIDLLSNYYSNHRLKKYYRKCKNQNDYEKIPVVFPLSEFRTIAEFEELRLNKNNSNISQDKRRKELFIYFYLYPISEDHPRLAKLKDIINLAQTLNSKILFYITPINIEAALRKVGEEFGLYFLRNIEAVKKAIIEGNGCFLTNKDMTNHNFIHDSVVCLDYSQVLGREYFFHPESIDEHLNQKGREFISKRNGITALKMLGR